jgi:hypothetical protein
MKLFEIVTNRTGESYVRSYAWCETEERARAMFIFSSKGPIAVEEVREMFDSVDAEFITEPCDCGFGLQWSPSPSGKLVRHSP